MPDSTRQQIVTAIIARMQTIRTANGYTTDIGVTVDDWPRDYAVDELPAVAVCDVSEESEIDHREAGIELHRLSVMIRVLVAIATPAATLRTIIGDVRRAVGVDRYWPDADGEPLAIGTYPRGSRWLIPADATETAAVEVEFEVGYTTPTFGA